ncbi:MAG: glutamate racemase [Spirochaetes bacterium]|nr:glutamate racemase [Spirochaetota bacterium]
MITDNNSMEYRKRPVLFFDSGVGGLPYLLHARKQLPGERFVYLADRVNFPYGEKTVPEIRNAVFRSIERINRVEKPKLIVIACNTASVVALSDLRSKFNLPFVGVVPAVKPAADFSDNGKLAVLATLRTTEDIYLKKLIDDFAAGKEVKRFAEGNLVQFVEKKFFDTSKQEKLDLLSSTLHEVKKNKYNTVVLGCTHFLLMEEELREVLGEKIRIVDSRDGVTNQIKRMLESYNLISKSKTGEDNFYVTGNDPPEKRYKLFAEKFGLIPAGTVSLV